MTRILWDTIFLISGTFSMSMVLDGTLFTFGAGPSNSTIIEGSISIDANSTGAPNASSSATTGTRSPTATTVAPSNTSSLFTFGASSLNMTEAGISVDANSSGAPKTNGSATNGSGGPTTTSTTTTAHPVKKFVAAAVRSHFDDCPDSHHHFCFHGTCRFLILEEAPACVCHTGFVGMRCEHADLLAVVATNHRKQTAATVLVLCVIGCVLIMVLCTLLHCWWTQQRRRRSRAHHYIREKHEASCHPSESVV
ncbi:protransforming growth factor alpha isoform 2-T2 [Spinachia spinachia]